MPYESFLNRANAFRELNQLPVPLAEGITVNDHTMNKGVWHNRLERAKRKRLRNGDEHAGIKRARPQRLSPEKNVCIFCGDESGLLHEFRTLEADSRVRSMATDLQDTALLAKIEGGDLIALSAAYDTLIAARVIARIVS